MIIFVAIIKLIIPAAGMKYKYLFLLLCCLPATLFGQEVRDQLLKELNRVIDSAAWYDGRKLERIDQIRAGRAEGAGDYLFFKKLYEEYKLFKFDSAFFYAKKMEETALAVNEPFKIAESRVSLGFVLLSAGMYKEADEVMSRIDISGQPDNLRAEYFLSRGRFYYDLADYTSDDFFYPGYFGQAGSFIDSALALYPTQSFEHIYYTGLKQIKAGDMQNAFVNLHGLMNTAGLSDHELALAASTLSFIYYTRGQMDTAVNYQIRAAIADIRSSTKETFAILNLAQILFGQGDFNRASLYIKKAVDDAATYGARQRKVQVSTILPIIQSSEINYVKRQRRLWIIYGAVVSFFLLVLAWLLVTIRRQNRKLEQAKKEISDAHQQLHAANGQLTNLNAELQTANANLQEANTKLEEANKIKEEYVGYFFTLDAEFFQKIERFKKSIEEKIHYGKFNEIKYIVNNINIKDEKEELVKSFDKAFLKLFPRFVDEFNALFDEENRIKLQEGELLNTDLRIYALLRLGIKENEKIAEILQYSVKSIYAYKTRIRNRARVPKEEFDRLVMSIRSI